MKFLFLSLIIGFYSIGFAQKNLEDGPYLHVENDTIHYGIINQDYSELKTLKITNSGTQPLIIFKCKASCGCTVPSCPSTPILPGKSDWINVRYDAKGKSGRFLKTITITSNAVNHTIYLKVKGFVKQ